MTLNAVNEAFPHSLNLQVGTMYGTSAFWKNQRLEAKRYCINQRYGKTKSDTSPIKVIKRQKEATDRILHVHKGNGANLISCSASAVETQHNKSKNNRRLASLGAVHICSLPPALLQHDCFEAAELDGSDIIGIHLGKIRKVHMPT